MSGQREHNGASRFMLTVSSHPFSNNEEWTQGGLQNESSNFCTGVGSRRRRVGCAASSPWPRITWPRPSATPNKPLPAGSKDALTCSSLSAEAALKHAKAAEKAKSNTHTEEGITHLEAAIAEGNKKNSTTATQHSEEALKSLESATK